MKLIKYAALAAIILVNTAFSQTTSLTGTTYDRQTGNLLPAATISVLNPDSSVIAGAVSNQKGEFKIDAVPNGQKIIRVSYIGYENYYRNVNVNPRSSNLGKIFLIPQDYEVEEVDVTAERNVITTSFDKKIINVEKSIISAGGSAVDVLRNSPLVNVDQDGNVSIRGSESVKILIDGKERASNLGADMLEMIRAEQIERIEVVTNPSARYEAEGSSGILNIVTKRSKEHGFSGIFNIDVGTGDKYGASSNLNYKYDGWNFFLNYNYRDHRRSGESTFNRETYSDLSHSNLIQGLEQRGSGNFDFISHSINPGFDWRFTEKDNLSFSVDYRIAERNRTSRVNSVQRGMIDPEKAKYNNSIIDNTDDDSYDISTSYKRDFEKKGHELFISAYYSKGADIDVEHTDHFYYDVNDALTSHTSWRTNNDEDSRNINAQLDYVQPMDMGIRLEFGVKNTNRHLNYDYNFYNYDFGIPEYIVDPSKRDNFVYDENIAAVYAIVSDSIGALKLQGGLRGEYAIVDGLQNVNNKSFEKNYFDVFPTAHIQYGFATGHSVNLSYTRRINRPRSHFLNPNVDYIDSLNVRVGNPELNPEYINSFEFGLENYTDYFDAFTTVFYRVNNDNITRFSKLIDSTGVMEQTFINLAKQQSYGVELVLQKNLWKMWRITADLSYYRTLLSGSAEDFIINNDSYNYRARITNNIMLGKNLSFQLSANYMSPSATAQGRMYEVFNVDAGGRIELFNRKLALFARISDIFNTNKWKFDVEGPTYKTLNEFKRESRVITVGATYRFNAQTRQQPDKRRNRENIEMDDFE